MKVALVQDWLTGMRGGEKVFERFCRRFPEAPIYTLVHVPGSVSGAIESHPIHASFVQGLPGAQKRYQRYLPLFPAAIERFDLRGYDLVLSSSHCAAKGVIVHPGTRHLCYCHTPMRYVWSSYEEYFGSGRVSGLAARVLPFVASYLRQWDQLSASRVDSFAANSAHVARRIRRYYGRDARVIHPWVDVDFFTPEGPREDFYLVVTALVPYKRVDLVLEAARRLDRPFVIVGDGVERERLERNAPANVRFLGWLPEEPLRDFYRRCRALLFPGEEDFGIVPVEAQATGAPVIGLGRGGLLETVREDERGVFFAEPTADQLCAAIERFESRGWEHAAIRDGVLSFGPTRFEAEIDRWLADELGRSD
ncbi:MAG: glycosyltransferase [Candidatus Eisenbacteria bacterium]|nr:glycosyltransferase [Candidatus Eisenbacteria bacterium]